MTRASVDTPPADLPPPAMIDIMRYGALCLFLVVVLHFGVHVAFGTGSWVVELVVLLFITFLFKRWLFERAGIGVLLLTPMLVLVRGIAGAEADMRAAFAKGANLAAMSLVVTWCLLTEVFAGWTAFWYERGLFASDAGLSAQAAFAAAERLYVWNFVGAVPLMDIPQTLHWDLGRGYDNWRSGTFVLVYRLLTIGPIIGGILTLARMLSFGTDPSVRAQAPGAEAVKESDR